VMAPGVPHDVRGFEDLERSTSLSQRCCCREARGRSPDNQRLGIDLHPGDAIGRSGISAPLQLFGGGVTTTICPSSASGHGIGPLQPHSAASVTVPGVVGAQV
jgi:hypothetical protein